MSTVPTFVSLFSIYWNVKVFPLLVLVIIYMNKIFIGSVLTITSIVFAYAEDGGASRKMLRVAPVQASTTEGGVRIMPVRTVEGRPVVARVASSSPNRVEGDMRILMPVTGDPAIDAQIKTLTLEMEAKIKAINDEYRTKIKTLIGDRPLKNGMMASGTPFRNGIIASGTPLRGDERGENGRMMGSGTPEGVVKGEMIRQGQEGDHTGSGEAVNNQQPMKPEGKGFGAQLNALFRGLFGR
jgi:hypothetical protein